MRTGEPVRERSLVSAQRLEGVTPDDIRRSLEPLIADEDLIFLAEARDLSVWSANPTHPHVLIAAGFYVERPVTSRFAAPRRLTEAETRQLQEWMRTDPTRVPRTYEDYQFALAITPVLDSPPVAATIAAAWNVRMGASSRSLTDAANRAGSAARPAPAPSPVGPAARNGSAVIAPFCNDREGNP